MQFNVLSSVCELNHHHSTHHISLITFSLAYKELYHISDQFLHYTSPITQHTYHTQLTSQRHPPSYIPLHKHQSLGTKFGGTVLLMQPVTRPVTSLNHHLTSDPVTYHFTLHLTITSCTHISSNGAALHTQLVSQPFTFFTHHVTPINTIYKITQWGVCFHTQKMTLQFIFKFNQLVIKSLV